MEDPRISVVGLGKLGVPLAVAMAARGYTVIGTDTNPQAVAAIKAGWTPRSPREEPGLAEMLTATEGRLSAVDSTVDAVADTDITFIIVPTPSGDDGTFANDYVLAACSDVAAGLLKDTWHLVVVTSTVMPGSSRHIIQALQQFGAREGAHFGYCYSPLFIALGNVLDGILRPDMLLIGATHPTAGAELLEFYRNLCYGCPPVVSTDPFTAELAKLLLNSFLTTKIAFANFIGWIAHETGAKATDITRLIGLDRRVSPLFFSPGPPFGGPCFPRDGVALTAYLNDQGLPSCFPLCVDDLNFDGARRLAEIAEENAGLGGTVAILGMTYKTGSPVMDDSPSTVVLELLLGRGFTVVTTDPWLDGLSPEKAIQGADVVIIMHNDERYTRLPFQAGQAIIDPWNLLACQPAGTHLIQIGGGT